VRPLRRFALGSVCGALYFILYYVSTRAAAPQYQFLQAWPALVLVSIGMLVAAFAPLTLKQLPRVCGIYYFIAVSSGGAGLAVGFALGWSVPMQLIVSIAAILVVAEVGWGVIQKSLWQRLYHVPIQIGLLDEKIETS